MGMRHLFSSALHYRWLVWLLLVATYMISFFHRMSASVVKESLMQQFGLSVTEFGTLASMYFYAYCIAQLPTGLMADSIGVRRTAGISAAVAGLGTIAFGCATSPSMLFISRFVVGLGVASSFVCVMKIQSQWFRAREFSTLAGLCLFLGNIGSVCAQAPLGLLVEAVTMRGAFWAIGVATLALSALCLIFVRNTPQDMGFEPIAPQAPAAQRVPLRTSLGLILRDKRLLLLNAFYFFMGSQLLGFAGAWSISYIRDVYQVELTLASTLASAQIFAFMLGSLVLGYLSDKYGKRKFFVVTPFFVVGVLWVALALGGSALPLVACIALLAGVGFFSGAFSVMMTLCKELSPKELTGTAIAVLNTSGFLGIALSTPLYGYLVDVFSTGKTPSHAAAVGLIACMSVLACVISLFFTESGEGGA